MIVCNCNAISEKKIEQAIVENNIKNISELQQNILIGNQCGLCLKQLKAYFD